MDDKGFVVRNCSVDRGLTVDWWLVARRDIIKIEQEQFCFHLAEKREEKERDFQALWSTGADCLICPAKPGHDILSQLLPESPHSDLTTSLV